MSALFVENLATPTAVLVASLLGSGHCAAMCGPLALHASPTAGSLAAYHGGRLGAYVALGMVAGAAGGTLLPAAAGGWVAACLLAGYFLWAAYRLARGRGEPSLMPRALAALLQPALGRVAPLASRRRSAALATGALTALLPCGWLHTFVVAAMATKSTAAGGILLATFWVGTVPALAGGAFFLRRLLSPGRARPAVTALLLVAAALGTVWVRAAPLLSPAAPTAAPSCGGHARPG